MGVIGPLWNARGWGGGFTKVRQIGPGDLRRVSGAQ